MANDTPLFDSRPEYPIVSYDYYDISNGVGYDIYYGFSMAGTTGTTTQSSVNSGMTHKNGEAVTGIGGTYVEMFDFDWDITFNTTKNIRGDILAQIPSSSAVWFKARCPAEIPRFRF